MLTVRVIDRGTLHGEVDGVAVSFIEYGYPLIEESVPWPECSCHIASQDDLACMKIAAVASRGSRRDFIDVFALIRSGIPLVRMLELYQQKYGVHDVAHVLASLCYFDDAESETMPELLLPVSWDEVKSELGHSVRSVG
jgi:hypothetical protein